MTIKEYAAELKQVKEQEAELAERRNRLQRKLDEEMNDKLKFN
jgi:hypothetical protein